MKPIEIEPAKTVKVSNKTLVLCDPLVTENAVYVGDGRHLIKLDRHSLEEVWRISVGDDGFCFPSLVHEPVVIVVDASGVCAGISTESGRRLWGPAELGFCLAWKDKILAVQPLGYIEAATGRVARELSPSVDVTARCTVGGDIVVGWTLHGNGDPVTAYHLAEERTLWTRDLIAELTVVLRGPMRGFSFAGAGRIVAVGADRIAACSLEDGEILWTADMRVPSWMAIGDGRVYGMDAGHGEPARLVCLDLKAGALVYAASQPLLGPREEPFRGRFWRDHVVCGTHGGLVISFNEADGRPSWYHRHSSAGAMPPIVDGDRAFVHTEDGLLLVFDLPEETSDEANETTPYMSTVVVRGADGKEEIHICAGGSDGRRLAAEIIDAFAAALSKHRDRAQFGGHIKVVILGHTPDGVRAGLTTLRTHLEALAKETGRVHVSFEEQEGSW